MFDLQILNISASLADQGVSSTRRCTHWFCQQVTHCHKRGHKTSLNKILKAEILLCIFTDHNGIKLKINNESYLGNNENSWNWPTCYWLSNNSLKKQKGKFLKFRETEAKHIKTYRYRKSNTTVKVYKKKKHFKYLKT